jgi:ABC-type uncharacterized transport system substrate-binding protein
MFKDVRAIAVRHTWTYDAAYSSFAIRGIDANKDGVISPDELENFAKGQLEALAGHNYFTTVRTSVSDVLTASCGARRRREDASPC